MNIKLMEIQARTVLAIADNEQWPADDGTRILANLALEAAGQLHEIEEAARALAEMRRLFGPDWESEVKRFKKATEEV